MHAPAKLMGPIAAAASSGSSDHVGHSAAERCPWGCVGWEGDGVSLGVTDGDGCHAGGGWPTGCCDWAGEVHPARVTRAMAAMARMRFMRQR